MSVLWFLQQAKGKTADEIDQHIDAPLHMEVALCTDRWCVIYLNCCAQFNLKCCFAQGGLGTATKRSRFFEFKICKQRCCVLAFAFYFGRETPLGIVEPHTPMIEKLAARGYRTDSGTSWQPR